MANNLTIDVIQGDTLTINFTIRDEGKPIDPTIIEKVTFSSNRLSATKKLIYNKDIDTYDLFLTSIETGAFPIAIASYDLTIKFTGGAIATVVYDGGFNVLRKTNSLTEVLL